LLLVTASRSRAVVATTEKQEQRRLEVRLTPPAQTTWLVAVVLGLLGILIRTGALHLPGLGIDSFWLVVIAFLLLVIAPLAKGL
jgi:hypothetical protein